MEIRNTGIRNVKARISRNKKGTAPIIIYGRAVDAKTGKPFVFSARHQRTIRSESAYEAAVQYLIDAIMREFEVKNPQKKSRGKKATGSIMIHFMRLSQEEKENLCYGVRGKWGETTTAKALSYFVNKILPLLDEYDGDVDINRMEEIIKKLTVVAMQNGNSLNDIAIAERGV